MPLAARSFALLLALATALAACPPARSPEDTAGRSRPLPLHRFVWSRAAQEDAGGFYFQPAGLCDDYPEETTTLAKIRDDFAVLAATGATLFRFGIGWDAIEEARGRYDFRFWDEVVDTAARRKITLIPYVAYTPAWIAAGATDAWRRPPRDVEAFARFLGVLAARYRGRVGAWELWNEPDNEAYWTGSAEEYARLVKAAAIELRRVDPGSVIVLGGMARGRSPFFEELVRYRGVIDHVDVVNLHGYLETWSNDRIEAYPAWIDAVADLLPRPGPDLWLAEVGYSSHRYSERRASAWGVDIVGADEHTTERQARALFETHVLALATGKLSLTAWYRIHDLPAAEPVIGDDNNRYLGVVDEHGRPKPAFFALRLYTRLFSALTRLASADAPAPRAGGSDRRVYVFETKPGDALVVGWLRSRTRGEIADASGRAVDARRERVSVHLPGAYHAMTIYDVEGRVIEGACGAVGPDLEGIELRGGGVFIAKLDR